MKKTKLVSPPMKVKWAHIINPHDYKNSGKPKYKLTALLDADSDECKEFKGKIDELIDEAFAEAQEKAKPKDKDKLVKQEPYHDGYVYDREAKQETDELDGTIHFKFSKNATYTDKQTKEEKPSRPVGLYNKDRQKVTDPEFQELPFGSLVRVSLEANQYNVSGKVGVSLKMNQIQILDVPDTDACAFDDSFDDAEGYSGGNVTKPASASDFEDDGDEDYGF